MMINKLPICLMLVAASMAIAPIASVGAQTMVPVPAQEGSDIISKGGSAPATTNPGSAYGSAICNAGDFDGDGVNDLVVGSRGEDTGATDAGMIELISGADQSVLFSFMGTNAFDQFGYSVHCAGDLNGDGFADVIIGAPFADPGNPNAGQIVVINGGDGGVTVQEGELYRVNGPEAFALFGEKVRRIGDVNGDTIGDLLVSARGFNGGRGAVHLLSGADGAELRVIEGENVGDFFGASIASIPDLTGDGIDDILVGAIGDDDGGNSRGSLTVLDSDLIGSAATASVLSSAVTFAKINGTADFEQYGTNVSCAGDYNNDGVFDIVVGNPSASDVGKAFCGEVKVLSGRDIDTTVTELFALKGISANDQFGIAVSDAGDVNGDGFDDILAGTYKTTGAFNAGSGAANVIFGSPMGALGTQTLQGTSDFDFYGSALTSMGDLDGDGFSDFAVGAYADHTTNGDDTGSVRMYKAFNSGGMNPTLPFPVRVYHSENRRDLETIQMRWEADTTAQSTPNPDPYATTGKIFIKTPELQVGPAAVGPQFVYFVSSTPVDFVQPAMGMFPELLLLISNDPTHIIQDRTDFNDPLNQFFFNPLGEVRFNFDRENAQGNIAPILPSNGLLAGLTVYFQIFQLPDPVKMYPFRWSNGIAMTLE
ncbi:MAG: hypothetical protein ACI97A_000025 [Planctomycetota bacterium]|jgi:hypothetical protein